MQRTLTFLLLVVLGCASSSRPADIPRPDIGATIPHHIFFGSGGSAPANVAVSIYNRADVPITVRRVEVSSPGMAQYRLIHAARDVREVIPPRETKEVVVFTTAVSRVSNPNEPLTMRVIVEFETNGKRWREVTLGI